jgi:hypothetical protein
MTPSSQVVEAGDASLLYLGVAILCVAAVGLFLGILVNKVKPRREEDNNI